MCRDSQIKLDWAEFTATHDYCQRHDHWYPKDKKCPTCELEEQTGERRDAWWPGIPGH